MIDIRMWLAGEKQYFTRGSNYINIIISILVITANIRLFEGFITPLLPDWLAIKWLYVLAVIGYPIGCRMLGYIDKRWGIWSHENNWTFYTSPWSQEILDAARIIIKEHKAKGENEDDLK